MNGGPAIVMDGPVNGLSEAEAVSRRAVDGFNEIPPVKRRNVVAIALEVVMQTNRRGALVALEDLCHFGVACVAQAS